jgi:predicted lipoprotein with Yx(FWY)xxD motif
MQRAPFLTASAIALTLAACGGGGSGSSGSMPTTVPTTAPTTASTPASTPQEATVAGSTAFVGSNGHTLYVFSADTPNVSNCNSSNGCTTFWPPYAAPAGTKAPSGTSFGIITRSDGTLQWTYNSQPLYEYAGDTAAGQDNGQGLNEYGGLWSTARPSGTATASPTTSATSSPTSNPYIRH